MFVSLTDSYEKPQLAQFRKFATTHVPTDYAAAFAALQPVAVRYYVSKRTGAGACCSWPLGRALKLFALAACCCRMTARSQRTPGSRSSRRPATASQHTARSKNRYACGTLGLQPW